MSFHPVRLFVSHRSLYSVVFSFFLSFFFARCANAGHVGKRGFSFPLSPSAFFLFNVILFFRGAQNLLPSALFSVAKREEMKKSTAQPSPDRGI